jgi:hypothetical protein
MKDTFSNFRLGEGVFLGSILWLPFRPGKEPSVPIEYEAGCHGEDKSYLQRT